MMSESESQITPTVLQVSSTNEHYPDYTVVFVITLNRETARRLLTYRPLFEVAQTTKPDLYKMEFWNRDGVFVIGTNHNPDDPEGDEGAIPDPSIDDEDQPRTECEFLVVTKDGVRWETYIRRVDNCTLSTQEELTWAELEEKARDPRFTCANCGEQWPQNRMIPLEQCADLPERLDPGSIVPHGECPECGAFVYESKEESPRDA